MRILAIVLIVLAACGTRPAVNNPGTKFGGVITPSGGGGSSGVSGSGTSGKLARFTGTSSMGNGSLSDDGAGHITAIGTGGYVFDVQTSGNDADNRAYQCSSTWSGTGLGYCYHGLMSANSPSTPHTATFGCVNSGTGGCQALETPDGDVLFNEQTGTTKISGDVTIQSIRNHMDGTPATHLFTLGSGGTTNIFMIEKHNTAPTMIAACQTGTGFSAAVDNKWSDFQLGSTATFPCTITFASPGPFSNVPSCLIVPHTGANEASLTYSVTGTAITISAGTPGAIYSYFCGGH